MDSCKILSDEIKFLKLKLAEERMARRKAINEKALKHNLKQNLIIDRRK